MIETESPYYKQGFAAFKTNQSCAYSPMSTKGEMWQMGFDDASDYSYAAASEEECVDPDSVSIEDSLDYTQPDEELD
mgnify:CR=1 FL=1